MAEVLKGKPVSDVLIANCQEDVAGLKALGIIPTLAIVRVGNNESDLSYERTLKNKADKIGIQIRTFELNNDADEDLLRLIVSLNDDIAIHGILMFRPLPKTMDENAACNLIALDKDVDCVNRLSAGRIFTGGTVFYPCTAEAVIKMLDFYDVDLKGKNVVILGRSMVVGKPLAMMLMDRNATITICHSKTKDLIKHTKDADIIVSCMGQKEMIDSSYIGNEQIVIDVGVNFDPEKGTITGDCAYDKLLDVVKGITPVPGGVGTVTSTILLKHVVDAAKKLC